MGQSYSELTPALVEWIERQHVFFVATAPLAGDGLVNCSPKGLDTFRVLDPRTVGYLDLTGSGVETIAHLRENGRIVVVFCSFDDPPKILRLHGRGRPLLPDEAEFAALRGRFPDQPGVRAIVRVEVERIADSCGYGVPRYEPRGERETLAKASRQKGEDGLARYRAEHNRRSLDGLPGLD